MILQNKEGLKILDSKQKIAKLKATQFGQAKEAAIIVKNNEQIAIGKLIPIGQWIEDEIDQINKICSWRNTSNKMFPTQIEATCESTLGYIKKASIANEYGILFGIFDVNDIFVGHIGVTDVKDNQFELAHLIRGLSDGDPKLVYYSEIALIDWCFREFNSDTCVVEVMSYNWIVSMMHKDIGFEILTCYPLKRIEHSTGGVTHQVVQPEEANVKYSIVKMGLDKNIFYKRASWTSN